MDNTKNRLTRHVNINASNSHDKGFSSDRHRLIEAFKNGSSDKLKNFFNSILSKLTPTRKSFFIMSLATFSYVFILDVLGISFFNAIELFLRPISYVALLSILLLELLDKETIKKEIDIFGQIQKDLLPPSYWQNNTLRMASFLYPAREIGGDYLDIIETSKGTLIVIADVSDKGLGAGLYMVRIQGMIHMLIQQNIYSPRQIALELNDLIKSQQNDKTFVTMAIAFFPNDTSNFQYIRAGHDPFIMYHHNTQNISELNTSGIALGMVDQQNLNQHLVEKTIEYKQHDKLLLYTDGLIEMRNTQEEEYGQDRIKDMFSLQATKSPQEIIDAIRISLEYFTGERAIHDDIAFSCIELSPYQNK